MLCFKMNLEYARIEICIDREFIFLNCFRLSNMLMRVLLHLFICTALRAHMIVVEAKIIYYYYYDSHWLSPLFVRLKRQICLCAADRQTDRNRQTERTRNRIALQNFIFKNL